MCVHAHVHSLPVICVSLDDEEDQKVGKRDDTVEEQVGEQQPGPAADGRGGEHLSFDFREQLETVFTRNRVESLQLKVPPGWSSELSLMLLSSFSVVNFPYEVSEVICHWPDRVCVAGETPAWWRWTPRWCLPRS